VEVVLPNRYRITRRSPPPRARSQTASVNSLTHLVSSLFPAARRAVMVMKSVPLPEFLGLTLVSEMAGRRTGRQYIFDFVAHIVRNGDVVQRAVSRAERFRRSSLVRRMFLASFRQVVFQRHAGTTGLPVDPVDIVRGEEMQPQRFLWLGDDGGSLPAPARSPGAP